LDTPWHQHYAPIAGSIPWSALVAALPLVLLLVLLAIGRFRAMTSALLALVSALLISIVFYQMPPVLALMSAFAGALYGLFPIGWIVVGAIFIYDLAVASGTFDALKRTIAGLSADRRLQALLIAFSFGAFLEGASGFGTPVAISAAMLIGLGFPAVEAGAVALLGNTAPVAFAGLGTPLIALAGVTGLPLLPLGEMTGRMLFPFALVVPFWIVALLDGWRGVKEVWPACLVAGSSYAIVQVVLSSLHGPWIVGISCGLASMASLVLLLRIWHPGGVARPSASEPAHGSLRSWIPWIALSVLAFVWGLPIVSEVLNRVSFIRWSIPLLDGMVVRTAPIVRTESAVFTFNWLSAAGTSLVLAGVLSGLLLRLRPVAIGRILVSTAVRMRIPLTTIVVMLMLGFTMRYAGMDTTLGLFFAETGGLFPFFSPMVGWIGVVLTGSDTSSNVLFGNLQTITAQTVGIAPMLAAAANTVGGVMGKMINAQSIVVATAASGQVGKEGAILRRVFWHSVALVVLVGVMTCVMAGMMK